MAPGERPALVHGASIYQVVQGALERAEWAGEPAVAFRPVRLRGDAVEPVLAEADLQVVAATAGEETMLTEEQVERALRKLRESDPGAGEAVYAYFAGGRMFAADGNGRLAAADHPAAEPVSWPLAHQVRPAQQSLGFRGCGECHSAGSSFFFHTVRGEGPLRSDRMASFAGHDRMKLSRPYQKLFGLSFTFQPLLKWTLSASGLLVGAMLLLALLAALARASGIVGRKG
ncbi:MAG: hypothetical protein FJW35_18175 [Acidobacteria bacterium]|nr:hypothetical protein [Acidobacteriota bacterium]